MLRLILLLMFLHYVPTIHAQSPVIQAIEVYFPSSQGSTMLPEISQFISGTRTPSVFRSDGFTESDRRLNYSETGFAIFFIVRNDSNSVHEWMAGISSTSSNGDLYELTGIINGESVNSSISQQMGYFNLHGGYRYVFREGRRLTFRLGGMVSLGIPISARTFEELRFDTQASASNRYFSRKGLATDLSVPLEARLKIIRNVSAGIRINPGVRVMALDGTTVVMRTTGGQLNFSFELRN